MTKKKFRLQHVEFCKSCAVEIVNTDSFVIFADRNSQGHIRYPVHHYNIVHQNLSFADRLN